MKNETSRKLYDKFMGLVRVLVALSIFAVPYLFLTSKTGEAFGNWVFFSKKSYAKKIEVKTYILSPDQAAALFLDSTQTPQQLSMQELKKFPEVYLSVRVKNLGREHAWAKLTFFVPGIQEPIEIPINSIWSEFSDHLICLESTKIENKSTYPEITFKWNKLHTK